MTSILLATTDTRFERRVRRALGEDFEAEVRMCSSELEGDVAEVAEGLWRQGSDVVALGPGLTTARALALAAEIDTAYPELAVMLVAQATPPMWSKAIQAGVRGIVSPNARGPVLREAFEQALVVAARRRVLRAEEADNRRRVICVMSPKGGSGKTTISTNIAIGLAARAPGEVVIVDLDLQFGDVASALSLIPDHTMMDVARRASVDTTELKLLLTPHPSGLYALCAPDSPAEGEEVRPEYPVEVIKQLSEAFRYVVVDTSAGLDEHALSAAEMATDLVLVAAMDVPGVRSLRKAIDALDQLGMRHAQRHVVLNRADTRVGLNSGDIAATLGLDIDVFMPSSRDVPASVNAGTPILESNPRSPVAPTLLQLVDRFLPGDAHHKPATWFQRLFSSPPLATAPPQRLGA